MSKWVYVSGNLEVEVRGRTQFEQEYILKTILSHAPEMTGSERNVKFSVNKNREIGSRTPYGSDELIKKDYLNGFGNVPTYSYTISINGSLRDRELAQTKREVDEFLKYICNKLVVEEITSVIILRDGFQSIIYSDFEHFETNNQIERTENYADNKTW